MFNNFNTRIFSQRSCFNSIRNFASAETGKSSSSQMQNQSIPNVQGLSDRVVKVPAQPVGFAGASKDKEYKNPEYYCYHVDSFGDSMLELAKYRLPPPSNKAK